jgi:hypothetical protein
MVKYTGIHRQGQFLGASCNLLVSPFPIIRPQLIGVLGCSTCLLTWHAIPAVVAIAVLRALVTAPHLRQPQDVPRRHTPVRRATGLVLVVL